MTYGLFLGYQSVHIFVSVNLLSKVKTVYTRPLIVMECGSFPQILRNKVPPVRFLNLVKIPFVMLTFITYNSNASLIEFDKYLWDSQSGLDWLKLAETQGVPFNHISSLLGENELYDGWSYASLVQFEDLIINFGGIPMNCSGSTRFCGASITNNSTIAALIPLIGITYSSSSTIAASNGMISEINSSGAHYVAGISQSSNGNVFIDPNWTTNRKQEFSPNMGSFLVRQHVPVPEPSTFAILVLGIMSLIVTRFKSPKSTCKPVN